jgi:hypothetical protein
MAGSPLKRQRREAAEAARGKRASRVDVATRGLALQRAAQVGDEQAAKEFGVKQATIRSWRRRAKAEPAPTASVGMPEAPASVVEGVERQEGPAERRATAARLRRDAADARLLGHEARAQSRTQAAAGDSASARNTATVAGIMISRSIDLEAAARKADEDARALKADVVRLEGERAQLMADVITAAFTSLGLTPPRHVLRHLLEQAGSGKELDVPEELWRPARDEVFRRRGFYETSPGGPLQKAVDVVELGVDDELAAPQVEPEADTEVAEGVDVEGEPAAEPDEESEPPPDPRREYLAAEAAPVHRRLPERTGRVSREPRWHSQFRHPGGLP